MIKKLRALWPAALWALLLLPFFLGAQAAHPATDDFTFAAYTHPTWVQTGSLLHVVKDALSYALRTWRDWQGTVTGVILMALNPAVFSLPHYGGHAVLLLALHLAAWYAFCAHMLGRRLGLPARLWRGLYWALSACSLLFLPDIVEGIYWFNGAWFYTGSQAAALLALVVCDRLSESSLRGARLALSALGCAVLLFALGMDNYITAMMTCATLAALALARAWAAHSTPLAGAAGVITREGTRAFGGKAEQDHQTRAAWRTALCLLPIGAGLLLSVVAPGNSVRMATDGAHQSGLGWLLASVWWTLRDAAGYVLRFTTRTPLLAVLLLCAPAMARAAQQAAPERARRCPPVWATLLGLYGILCAMIIPHMYSSGYAGSGRVVNMYHLYMLLAAPVAAYLALLRLSGARRVIVRRAKACYGLGAAALALCLFMGQQGNYVKLVRDQLDGTQQAYIAQFQHEYALCEAAGAEDDVLLPAWTVQTVTGKPTAYTDPTVWTNEAMAHYFGVKSVRVAE
ncbi:MAG: DUF6056 family protein [Candidatus Ventricola sp.]